MEGALENSLARGKTRQRWTKHRVKTFAKSAFPVISGSFKSRRHREANGTAAFSPRIASADFKCVTLWNSENEKIR